MNNESNKHTLTDNTASRLEASLNQADKHTNENNQTAKVEPKSAYEACVLSEAAKVHALIAKAQREARERALKEKEKREEE